MIILSYFNNPLVHQLNLPKFSIALGQFDNSIPKAEELLLKPKDFWDYKKHRITIQQLFKQYRINILNYLDIKEIVRKYNNCIFLCHEKVPFDVELQEYLEDKCHRQELFRLFKEHGVPCTELTREVYLDYAKI